jgi:hypothetical protein
MRVFSRSEGFTPVRIEHPFVPRTTADSGEFPCTGADQLDSTIPPFAKVGVESSNPFARFKLASEILCLDEKAPGPCPPRFPGKH